MYAKEACSSAHTVSEPLSFKDGALKLLIYFLSNTNFTLRTNKNGEIGHKGSVEVSLNLIAYYS